MDCLFPDESSVPQLDLFFGSEESTTNGDSRVVSDMAHNLHWLLSPARM